MKKSSLRRLFWIDLEKGVAIFAVVVAHLYGILYKNFFISSLFSYSVTLFIMVAGYNSALALENHKIPLEKPYWKHTWSRIKKIIIVYFIATLIYHIYSSGYELLLSKFLTQLFFFSVRPAFYFIVVYIQLLIVSPLILKSILRRKIIFQIFILIIIYFISILLLKRTYVRYFWDGARNILGGTYLFAYALGIFLYDTLKSIKRKEMYKVLAIIFILVFFFFKKKLYIGIFSNPPNNDLLYYSLIIFLIVFLTGNYLGKTIFSIVLKPFSFIGRYSLYIYLYHTMAIEVAREIIIPKGWISKSVENYFIFFFALFMPIIFVNIYYFFNRLIKS